MLRRLSSRLTYANVVATMALFVALGGSAYAVNTVRSTDIVDGEVKSVDIGNNEIGSGDIKDNSVNTFDVHSFLGADVADETLTGADIATGSLTASQIAERDIGINVEVGSVAAQSCRDISIGLDGALDEHLLLTPSWADTSSSLSYTTEYRAASENVMVKVCNPTATAIDDARTTFKFLVIDAQRPGH